MKIAGIVKSSLVDFPGLISTVLFTNTCNMNCFYCHNRQLINGLEKEIDNNYIQEFLNSRVGQIEGIVISGGEPTLQSDLILYIKNLKALGYAVKLDTNGTSPHVIKEILKYNLCDYYAVDYKAPLLRYKEITNYEGDKVLETINLLNDYNASFEVRTTLIPQLSKNDLIVMAKELPNLKKYVINQYIKPQKYLFEDEKRINVLPYSIEQINQMIEVVKTHQPFIRLS